MKAIGVADVVACLLPWAMVKSVSELLLRVTSGFVVVLQQWSVLTSMACVATRGYTKAWGLFPSPWPYWYLRAMLLLESCCSE